MGAEMSGESPAAAEGELMARAAGGPWGTWEELVLGGAVLRHGTADWAPVAAELLLRFPYPFTPQECEAKYEDVQERFSGFDAWFEVLRRRRVEELKRELEKSQDSIGSLQLKLESLKAERESDENMEYNSGHMESPYLIANTEGTVPSSKEPSNDRSSAGSFIEETRSVWSPDPQIADSISTQGKEINVDVSNDSQWNMFGVSGEAVVVPGNLRKKRGLRKRRFPNDVKEGNTGVSNSGCSADVNREGSSKLGPSSENSGWHSLDQHQDLGGFLDEILKHKGFSLFSRQLETQKKARYRKLIRRHVDFQTIKSRIGDGSILFLREVFRDLLLLSNNALLFYPKHSREYRSALVLRELVTKRLQEDRMVTKSSNVVTAEERKMLKSEARESCDHKTTGSEISSGEVTTAKKTYESKKALGAGVAPTPPKKRRVGRPAKVTHGSQKSPKESPSTGRKKVKR